MAAASAHAAPDELRGLVAAVARALSESLGYRTVAISLYRPAWDDFVPVAVHGDVGAGQALLGTGRRGAVDGADGHALVPLARRDGGPLGMLALADSASGRSPARSELDALALRASLAARVIESRLVQEREERHRHALEHLIRVSTELVRGKSTNAVLQLVCDGIANALGFGHVVIELADPAADRYRPVAATGIDLAATDVQLDVPIDAFDGFFDPELEVEGCYLARREQALARLGEEPGSFASTTNGRGPYAWNRHWLLVPLHNRDAERTGFIWVDNPDDHLIPSRERLQALRLFADQAATALEVAAANESAFQELEERRQAEAALRKSQELHRRMIETSTDAIALFDLKGRVLFASPASRTILGYEPGELVGRRFTDLLHRDDVPGATDTIRRALSGEGPRPYTARFRHRDGHWVSLEGIPAPVHDDAGAPEMVLGIARDVTERKRADDERRSLEDQLRQAQKLEAVGRLAGGIAHDFNNLLTAIGGYGQLALAALPPGEPRPRRHVEEMLRAAERAASLTRQLLAFSRRQVIQRRIVDPNAVVRDVESMLGRLIGADVELVTSLDPELGRTHADPTQLEQVVVNLALNARDAMPNGGRLLIETANADVPRDRSRQLAGGPQPGAYVALTVADTGVGMETDTAAHAFEPFFTTKAPGEGTGLGLSTVYGIVKQSEGSVAVDSKPGRGTVVTVYLPRVDSFADVEARERRRPADASAPRGDETILVVEDDEIVRSLVHEMLEGLGYAVVDARDGQEALARLADESAAIDLVVTDVVMPRMSGRELARRVAELRRGTGVLLISGYAGDTAAQDPLEPGAAFLEKPFTGPELARKVRDLLDGAATKRARRAA